MAAEPLGQTANAGGNWWGSWWGKGGRGPISLVPNFPFLIRTDPLKAALDAMKAAEAFVDPSRLIFGRPIMPYNPSTLVTRKGLGVFDAMKRDEQVKACLLFKKATILAPGWEVVSPADQDEKWEVTQFVRNNFTNFPKGWPKALKKFLLAQDYGYSVTEKVYGDAAFAPGKLCLNRLSSAKPHYFDFEVSPYGEILALLQRYVSGITIGVELPPEKFVVYTHEQEFENPYGRSDLEAAYRAWWVKDNVYKWFAVYLERYGMSPLFALYDANVYQGAQLDQLKKVVKGIQNATLGIIPRVKKDDLEMWSQNISSESRSIFLAALTRFDADIGNALLVPSMLGVGGGSGADRGGGGSSGGSQARAQTHFESFLKVVEEERKNLAADAVNSQVIPQLCDLNWPGLTSYPEFKFLPLDDATKLTIYELWQKLVAGGIVNRIEDDEVHIRKALGMPENGAVVIEPLPAAKPSEGTGTGGGDIMGDGGSGELPPIGKMSAEMREFAEENDGVWVRVNGRAVCLAREAA